MFCQDTYLIFRDLNFGISERQDSAQAGPYQAWELRKELVRSTHQRMEQRYLRHCDVSQPIPWITKSVANVIMAMNWLTIYRPLSQATVAVPPDDRPNVLVLSVELLEKYAAFRDNPTAKRIEWLTANFVQWHPLAVSLAELCVQTEGALVERAWRIVDPYFNKIAGDIADSSRGMLWRPIKKLMSKAKRARQTAMEQHKEPVIQTLNTTSFDFNQLGPPPAFAPTMGDTSGLQMADALSQDAFNWDPWLSTNTTGDSCPYNAATAWSNWEIFLNDFQGESFMPGLEFGQPQDFSGS